MKHDNNDLEKFLHAFVTDARADDLIPKLKSSLFVMALLTGDADLQLALQIGLALLFDKPLVIIAVGNVWISARLRQIADIVIEGEAFDQEMRERIATALLAFLEKRKPV